MLLFSFLLVMEFLLLLLQTIMSGMGELHLEIYAEVSIRMSKGTDLEIGRCVQ